MTAGWYYQFVSYGSLSSDYNIRVGRSRAVTGPYLDANGKDLATLGAGNEDRVGTKLMGGYTFVTDPGVPASKGYMAPGHNSAILDGDRYFLVHHVRTYTLPDYWFTMNVRPFFLNKHEWPVVAPNRYNGETLAPVALPDGTYGLIVHGNDSNAQPHRSERFRFADGKIFRDTADGVAIGTYQIYDSYRMSIMLDGLAYDGVALRQFDGERKQDVFAFTVMSEAGDCLWGNTQLQPR